MNLCRAIGPVPRSSPPAVTSEMCACGGPCEQIGSHQERQVSMLTTAPPLEVPSSGKIALAGGAVTRTGRPNPENVSVATVVSGPRGRPSRAARSLVP
jgi:hypothetical protein